MLIGLPPPSLICQVVWRSITFGCQNTFLSPFSCPKYLHFSCHLAQEGFKEHSGRLQGRSADGKPHTPHIFYPTLCHFPPSKSRRVEKICLLCSLGLGTLSNGLCKGGAGAIEHDPVFSPCHTRATLWAVRQLKEGFQVCVLLRAQPFQFFMLHCFCPPLLLFADTAALSLSLPSNHRLHLWRV